MKIKVNTAKEIYSSKSAEIRDLKDIGFEFNEVFPESLQTMRDYDYNEKSVTITIETLQELVNFVDKHGTVIVSINEKHELKILIYDDYIE